MQEQPLVLVTNSLPSHRVHAALHTDFVCVVSSPRCVPNGSEVHICLYLVTIYSNQTS